MSRHSYISPIAAAWLLMFAFYLAVRGSEVGAVTLWALRVLTVALLLAALRGVVGFTAERIRAKRRGEAFFNDVAVKGLLLTGLAIGLALRVIAWDGGNQSALGWAGAALVVASFLGLLAFLARREWRVEGRSHDFFFNPLWKYGLVCVCVASLLIQGAATPTGALSTINVSVFLGSLIALIVQALGRRSRRQEVSA